MRRRTAIKNLGGGILSMGLPGLSRGIGSPLLQPASQSYEPFQPQWDSLSRYQVPDWFRDAKFGIWAHWGPQCQPERGDWYARGMYQEGSDQYRYHVEKYGHPSRFGFKDVIQNWKAEKWDPDQLVDLYKRAGAGYFMALANHHDNFDLFDSKYQPWNSTRIGPRKDLLAGWTRAAKRNGLPFGVSVHAAHAWTWYETSRRADKDGPFKGIPYDGRANTVVTSGNVRLSSEILYQQQHAPSLHSEDDRMIHKQWAWSNGASQPSEEYCRSFLNRTLDLLKYEPDLVYFDDTVLPLYPISNVGLEFVAHYYNQSVRRQGKVNVVVCGKILNEEQRKALVWDIERGQADNIQPLPWQTDTCIGSWHYDLRIFNQHGYKTAETVIHTLTDVVAKNGNLMLNIPLKGDGTMDSDEAAILEDIAGWMAVNRECIFGTRPWRVLGEGPAIGSVKPLTAQGFNEGSGKRFTAEDMRFTTKGDVVYAIVLGKPQQGVLNIRSLGRAQSISGSAISNVTLLGCSASLIWRQGDAALEIELSTTVEGKFAFVFKIQGYKLAGE